jgi:hypothetical protein
MDIDALLEELHDLCRRPPSKPFTADDAVTIATKFNQLEDWIESGYPVPKKWEQHAWMPSIRWRHSKGELMIGGETVPVQAQLFDDWELASEAHQ